MFQSATLLADGRVLVAGGAGPGWLTSAEIYDPVGATWTATGSLHVAREGHTATLLADGRVLVAGGYDGANGYAMIASSEVWDPATGAWTPAGAMAPPRGGHAAVRVADGQVLVAGAQRVGIYNNPVTNLVQEFDPTTGGWGTVHPLNQPQNLYTLNLLPDGKVLALGGTSNSAAVPTAELYDPLTQNWIVVSPATVERLFYTTTVLASGQVLVAGGSLPSEAAVADAELN